jgi:DNA invertase Pin-like site-specific DNA recombinase
MEPKIVLYARVSTDEQSLDPQLLRLREHAQARLPVTSKLEEITDVESGASATRPGLAEIHRRIRAGAIDFLVVAKLDRIARSVSQLVRVVQEMDAHGVSLVVVDQPIDTSTPSGRLLLHVLGAIAEFERELIRERTRAGMAAARHRGRRIGRPRGVTLDEARAIRSRGEGVRAAARRLGVSPSTVRRALERLA